MNEKIELNTRNTRNQYKQHNIEAFDHLFKSLVLLVHERQQDEGWMDEKGQIKFNVLVRKAGQTGSGGFRFFDVQNQVCKRIPSKEHVLLIATALQLTLDELKELLDVTGYDIYPKNLREFIICAGLNNQCTLEEIQDKLNDYGYSEQYALMKSSNKKSSKKKDKSDTINENVLPEYDISIRFKACCKAKNLKQKEVLFNAGLVMPDQSIAINNYYFDAFMGSKKRKIELTVKQCESLFHALQLTYEDARAFVEELKEADMLVAFPEEIECLLAPFKNESCNVNAMSKECKGSKPQDVSVTTSFVRDTVAFILWNEIDAFIEDTFSDVRTFARFYKELLHFNDFDSVKGFTDRFYLPESIQYKYIDGLSVPKCLNLTTSALLMPKMSENTYKTMLKKAGKHVFSQDDEMLMLTVMYSFLENRQEQRPLFGEVLTFVESTLFESEDTDYSGSEEWITWYVELCAVLERHFSKWCDKVGLQFEKIHVSGRFSDTFTKGIKSLETQHQKHWVQVLMNSYGFNSNSPFVIELPQEQEVELHV